MLQHNNKKSIAFIGLLVFFPVCVLLSGNRDETQAVVTGLPQVSGEAVTTLCSLEMTLGSLEFPG